MIARLRAEIARILALPDVKERLNAAGGLGTQLTGNASGTALIYTPMCGTPASTTCTGAALTQWDCKTGTTILPKYLPAVCR